MLEVFTVEYTSIDMTTQTHTMPSGKSRVRSTAIFLYIHSHRSSVENLDLKGIVYIQIKVF